ncbi:MAG: hypothetical protein ACLTS6_20845 [Anaerobutyricum sp.]
MLKERAKESIKFKAKAVIYENETGFKIIAGVAFNAKTGGKNMQMQYERSDV